MAKHWTRRQVLAQIGIAAAAVHTLDPHELCCAVPAHAKTTDKDLFELKKVADGVYAAVAAPAYKVNSNAAVIMTDDGVVVVDSHSKPSAARALYAEIQGITKKPVRKITHIIPGHGDVRPKAHLTFFRGYLTDLIAAVKTAAGGGATLEEMQKKIADQLAPKYEQVMSKYPLGRYRNRIGQNVEMVYRKVVKKG